ncbi:hypothetical protein KA082_00940 [Candidatus Woesebacteria bacterium]|nr:hypothetical protein [Candidatus Woesebacteria bacterium]
MKSVVQKWLGFARNKTFKAVVLGLLICVIVLGMSVVPVLTKTAQAACNQRSAYTDYYVGKPALMIYTGSNVPPNKDRTVIYYYVTGQGWEQVMAPSDDGVRTDAPQRNSGGWHTYFIATRWRLAPRHLNWNDDWRWRVIEC